MTTGTLKKILKPLVLWLLGAATASVESWDLRHRINLLNDRIPWNRK